MSSTRKLIGLLPFVVSFLLADKTIEGYCVAVTGGVIAWIPFWLAWWLSDGFQFGELRPLDMGPMGPEWAKYIPDVGWYSRLR